MDNPAAIVPQKNAVHVYLPKKQMAGKRIDIMDLRQLIRLKKEGQSNRKTASLLHVSRNTVNGYTKRIESYNLSLQELLPLSAHALRDLFPAESEIDNYRYRELAQYFPDYLLELKRFRLKQLSYTPKT